MKPIWLVDDDPSIRFVLEKALARENLPTRSFTHPREVLDALADVTAGDPARQGPQVLVSDIRMPGGSGLQLLEKVREMQPGLPVIIMTAYSDLDSAVSAFQRGAFEYLPKPFDLPKAVELIRRAVEESQREEVTEERQTATPEMLGQAPAMQDVFRAIGRLSQSVVTVLITGESGSGKELVAARLQQRVVDRAMQIFGAMGLSPDTPLAALWTWGRALRLMDGPDEVHLRTVARHELAQARAGLGASAAWFTTPEQLRAPPHLSA